MTSRHPSGNVNPTDAPALTEDALLLLFGDELTRQGVVGGTNRAEVHEACTTLAARGEIAIFAGDLSIIAPHPPLLGTPSSTPT